MAGVLCEFDLENVLASLGYRVTPATHCQRRVLCGDLTIFVGHDYQVWCWLKITDQFSHPTLFEAKP